MRALLASYALFPIKHGRLKIDAYKAKCSVASRSAFGFGKNYTYTKSSDEVSVNILPLPDANRPMQFGGAVGNFDISAKIEDRSFEQGQPFTMKLKIEGSGNAKIIELPQINLPDNIEFIDSKEEARFFTNGQSFKEFTIYLTPLQKGIIEIPSISFIYFDPSKMQYLTKVTKPLSINVKPAKKTNIQSARLDLEATDVAAELPKTFTDYSRASESLEAKWAYYVLVFLFFVSLIYLLVIAKKDLWTSSKKKIFLKKIELRRERLKASVKSEDAKDFAIEGLNFIYFLLGESLRSGHSSEKLSRNLVNLPLSLREKVEHPVAEVANKLQALAFAPAEMTKSLRDKKTRQGLYEQIQKVADDLIDYHVQNFVDD